MTDNFFTSLLPLSFFPLRFGGGLRLPAGLILLSGCGTTGLLNYVPTRSFVDRSKMEMREFITESMEASSENIQNELWPWMILIMVVYGVGKISSTILYFFQNRGLKRVINGCGSSNEVGK